MPFKIIAVDADGTLCEDKYPEIGEPRQHIIDRLIQHKQDGGKVILWTCRNKEHSDEIVEWAKGLGLEFDAVNDDLPEVKETDFGKSKSAKVYADIYLDDKNELVNENIFINNRLIERIVKHL